MRHMMAIAVALALSGCANNVGKSVLVKVAVLGLEASTATPSGPPALRIGLVRSLYAAVPTNAALASDVKATLGATREDVVERLSFAPSRPPWTNAPLFTNAVVSTNR